ncbi:TPA: HNH endonuclease [Corynebacterium striatum]|nr:HNH endonuclease [Corynebacterium striatum]
MTLDHVVPLSRGGKNTIGNALPACQSCNSSKHSKLLAEWKYIKAVRVAA